MPWLVLWTVVGAGVGYLAAPPMGGSSWIAERVARGQVIYTVAGALLGLTVGFVHDWFEKHSE